MVAQLPWTGEEIQRILDGEVHYKDWKFVVQERCAIDELSNNDVDLRMRAVWFAPDAVSGKLEKQQSRWWPLSAHMVKTEIIQTAFLCVLKAEEHEIRETFEYRGRAVFNTHIDINRLWDMSRSVEVRVDIRPKAPANQRRE